MNCENPNKKSVAYIALQVIIWIIITSIAYVFLKQ
jgi:hypothetical protein